MVWVRASSYLAMYWTDKISIFLSLPFFSQQSREWNSFRLKERSTSTTLNQMARTRARLYTIDIALASSWSAYNITLFQSKGLAPLNFEHLSKKITNKSFFVAKTFTFHFRYIHLTAVNLCSFRLTEEKEYVPISSFHRLTVALYGLYVWRPRCQLMSNKYLSSTEAPNWPQKYTKINTLTAILSSWKYWFPTKIWPVHIRWNRLTPLIFFEQCFSAITEIYL